MAHVRTVEQLRKALHEKNAAGELPTSLVGVGAAFVAALCAHDR